MPSIIGKLYPSTKVSQHLPFNQFRGPITNLPPGTQPAQTGEDLTPSDATMDATSNDNMVTASSTPAVTTSNNSPDDFPAPGSNIQTVQRHTASLSPNEGSKDWLENLFNVNTNAQQPLPVADSGGSEVAEAGKQRLAKHFRKQEWSDDGTTYFDTKEYSITQDAFDDLHPPGVQVDSGVRLTVKIAETGVVHQIDPNQIKMQGAGLSCFRCPERSCDSGFSRRSTVLRHVLAQHPERNTSFDNLIAHPTLATFKYGKERKNYRRRSKSEIAALRAANGGRLPPPPPAAPEAAHTAQSVAPGHQSPVLMAPPRVRPSFGERVQSPTSFELPGPCSDNDDEGKITHDNSEL